MRPTDLERDLRLQFFQIRGIDSEYLMKSFDKIEVAARSFTEAGFFVDFRKHDSLKVGESGEKYGWGEIGGRLNGQVHVGFEFYINEGYITMIEGFTYEWPTWPDEIHSYELFKEEIRYFADQCAKCSAA